MTKSELVENYTAEQLAEMVVNLQNDIKLKIGELGFPMDCDTLKCKCDKCGNEFIAVLDSDYQLVKRSCKKRKGENMNISDIQKCQEEYEKLLKESPLEGVMNKITKDILEQKNNAMAMEFTRIICDLLKRYGVHVHCTETKLSENITHNSIEEQYGIVFDSMDFSKHDKEFTEKIEELQSEVEKYRKAFEAAKKERDCQIAEYRKKIEELYYPLKTLEGNLKVSNMIIEETIKNENGEDSNTVKFSSIKQFAEYIKCFYTVNLDYIQKVLRGNEESQNNFENITDFLPTEPIKVADMLINAGGEYEHNPIVKKICGTDKGTYRIFEISELRQIAEHLLVYCNHNKEEKE